MPKSLQEYADWLNDRQMIWPQVAAIDRMKATAFAKPLDAVRCVVWSPYGTLIRISDGRVLLEHPQQIRMQVALDKTIKEFNMWNSMSRKPGAPWEYMLHQYRSLLEERNLSGTGRKGDFPEVDLVAIWRKLIGRLQKNEYQYDRGFYGELDAFSEKVAFFFHSCLQGVEASPHAVQVLNSLAEAGIVQGLLADAQSFSVVQMLRALRRHGTLPPLGELFDLGCLTLSHQEGVRKPSRSLYQTCLDRFQKDHGAQPHEILYVSAQLRDDLSVAKQVGMRTALYAVDKTDCLVEQSDMQDEDIRPDRLITDLDQVCQILAL
jgi:FMN phosphatase YigB (HAD superfamily)